MAQQQPTLPRLRAELERTPAADIEHFKEAVRPLLQPLARHVRREMAFLRARGDLEGDSPAAGDVVDETLVRAWEEQAGLDKGTLYHIASRVLADAVRQRRRERGRFVSLERRLPEQQALDEDIDQAVYDYWQPDQVLKLEDAVPIDAPTPEQAVEREELRRVLGQVLAELPELWRQAVLLTQAEDLPHAEVARQLGISQEELQRRIEHADAYLRARLSELGVGAGEAENAILPNAPRTPRAPADDSLEQAFDRVYREAFQRGGRGPPLVKLCESMSLGLPSPMKLQSTLLPCCTVLADSHTGIAVTSSGARASRDLTPAVRRSCATQAIPPCANCART